MRKTSDRAGLVEFSSRCGNTCRYCGLTGAIKSTALPAGLDELLGSVADIYRAGLRSVVLQSGEDGLAPEWLAEIIQYIKRNYEMAVTLSVGERSPEDYLLWKNAGADRYLLRIESSDAFLYESLHSGRRVETRIRCLEDLRRLGYQTGSGMMVGVKNQNIIHIAKDIFFSPILILT
ncbi:radical SAM protein [Brucepastera parasyntrophica]|uniref:radical SAM protein n=1 Tax=Brucepastera parasyntrophica TaxID=2880008 RepID=UPI00210D2A76|nr:radical SAM protein [Brucepastera parasyntrophica]ULQ58455.1 radical SAM protein [Brucepastera parasyntrophica]